MAYVPIAARKLYTPGLTYLDMLTYAARLRLDLDSLTKEEAKKKSSANCHASLGSHGIGVV